MTSAVSIAVVIATVVVVAVVVAVLARQGSVGRLSEEHGRRRRQDDVAHRPAGPGAEAMGSDVPGEPGPGSPGADDHPRD